MDNLEAPSVQKLSHEFDHILGRSLSGDLFILFETISASLKAMIQSTHYSKIQEFMSKFLFEQGFQEIGVRITDNSSNVYVYHNSAHSNSSFPQIKQPGDVEVVSHFFPVTIENAHKGRSSVNQLDGYFALSGMPPMQVIVQKLRELIVCGSANGQATKFPSQMGQNLLLAMRDTFPNAHIFASDLIDMRTIELDMAPCIGGIHVELNGEMNMASLEKMYPSMANLLKHLGEMDISIIDMHNIANQAPETDVHSARCMMQIRILYARGAIELKVCMMLPASEDNCLLWFSRATKECIVDKNGIPEKVDFVEDSTSYQKSFRVVIDGAMRIPQLGCGSIALPLIVSRLDCRSSKSLFPNPYGSAAPAHRFDITMLHMTDKRLTALLLKPFFNLDLLRFILLNHFHVQMEVTPPFKPRPLAIPSKDGNFHQDEGWEEYFDAQQEEIQDLSSIEEAVRLENRSGHKYRPSIDVDGISKQWLFQNKMHMFLPQPPRVITSCLSLFVGEQMASPDNVQMMIDMLIAMGKDLKLMNARLAREEGDENTALLVEQDFKAELEEEKQVAPARISIKIPKRKKRFWWWF